MDLITRTFSEEFNTLPTLAEIRKVIAIDGEYRHPLRLDTWQIREDYTNYSFCILSHEFILSITHLITNMKLGVPVELCCGGGWLSFWLGMYGISPIAADDDSWEPGFKSSGIQIIEKDAAEVVSENPDTGLFIISWPDYLSDVAYRVWEAMRPGQYLLYIGEGYGGCTANDSFHGAIEGKEVDDIWGMSESFLAFWGLHDRPTLYRK